MELLKNVAGKYTARSLVDGECESHEIQFQFQPGRMNRFRSKQRISRSTLLFTVKEKTGQQRNSQRACAVGMQPNVALVVRQCFPLTICMCAPRIQVSGTKLMNLLVCPSPEVFFIHR